MPEGASEEKESTKTALLPIAFFQGKELEPGSTCEVRVEAVEDDQVQVSYVAHEAESEEEEAEAELPPESQAEPEPSYM